MANKTFAPLLQRQAHVATLQRSQRLLTRYEVLLQLPSRVRQAAAQQDYEQLLTDYRSTKMLRGGLSQVPGSAVWSPLWEVRHQLCCSIRFLVDFGGKTAFWTMMNGGVETLLCWSGLLVSVCMYL